MIRFSEWPATLLACCVGSALYMSSAEADSAHFQFDGKIYNKWMYTNDASQGCVWLGNPAYVDNITGANGACSEFELGIRAQVSKNVRAGARLQSRWGAVWQDWWENGDIKYEDGARLEYPGDTSGESVGMNHAQYIKLRGFFIEAVPPVKSVTQVRVGASDLGMFNSWTIGKIRYIDRDNARGTFVQGGLATIPLKYEAAVIALPKLFAGPGWNIGNGDDQISNPFISQDYAYAVKLQSRPSTSLKITFISTVMNDFEYDLLDPDAPDTVNPAGAKDGSVNLARRFRALNSTFEVDALPKDAMKLYGLFAHSYNILNPDYVTNGVQALGFFPMVYEDRVSGLAGLVRGELTDPFDNGLSFTLEYFNIGEHYNAVFGSRREADVLLTDGFVDGGQLPTLNIANEFMDWDEPWFESAVGWHGATLVGTKMFDLARLKGEFTYLTYNTNAQDRDTTNIYPGFLYPDGFTDTDFYDYANVLRRGRDLRSVYRENEDRHTQFVVLWYDTVAQVGKGIDIKSKFKWIHDNDLRDADSQLDDYNGHIFITRLQAGYQINNEMSGFVGDELNHWREVNNDPVIAGNLAGDYFDTVTRKNKIFGGIEYYFGGVKLKYVLEWVVKDKDRSPDGMPEFTLGSLVPHPYGNELAYQGFNRLRSKASLEVAW